MKPLSQEDVLRVGIVSKHLRKLTRNIWESRFLSLSDKASNKDFIAIQKSDFCNVRLISHKNLTIESFKILGNVTALKRLKLCCNRIGVTIGNIITPALSFLTNLTALKLAYNLIGDTGIQHLSSLTNLREIVLGRAQLDNLSVLSSLTNLKINVR